MQVNGFREWMRHNGVAENTASARLSNCLTIERCERIDLDREYDSDGCEELLALFTYTSADEREDRLPRHHVQIAGNLRNGTSTYKQALKKYILFRSSNEDAGAQMPDQRDERQQEEPLESYQRFLERFHIQEDDLIAFGLEQSIFATPDQAMASFVSLRDALCNNQPVYIRKDGHGLYRRLYAELFGNTNILEDPDGNSKPHEAMSLTTGFTAHPERFGNCRPLHNYVLSHIFDRRTKNPLLFASVCNFAYTPTIYDPLTGIAVGAIAERFCRRFRERAIELFGAVYQEFKNFTIDHNVREFIEEYELPGEMTERQATAFRREAKNNWDVMFEIP